MNHYPNSHWVGTAKMGATIKSNVVKSKESLFLSTSTTTRLNNNNNDNDKSNNTNVIFDDVSIQTSVLDEELLVRGTTNLYVADASAIPIIPNGNVHSTVTIIASMAADFLRKKLQIFSPFL